MKKKTLITLLVTAMVCGSVVGCGKKAEPQPKDEPVVEASTEASSVEDASSTASTEEKVEEVVETKEYTTEDIANAIDFSKEIVEISADVDGVNMTLATKSGSENLMYMTYEKEVKGVKNQSGMYVVGDDIYLYIGADDTKYIKYHAVDKDGSYTDFDEASTTEEQMLVDTDSIVSVTNKGTEEIDGNTYDVVEVTYKVDADKVEPVDAITDAIDGIELTGTTDVESITEDNAATEDSAITEDSATTETSETAESTESDTTSETLETAVYYFNVETGKVDYIEAEDNGEKAMLHLTYKDSFEEPDWFAEAETMESDDMNFIVMAMSVIVVPMSEDPITEDMLNESLNSVDFSFDGLTDEATEDVSTEDASTEATTN